MQVFLETRRLLPVASRRVMEKPGLTLARAFHAGGPYRIEGDEPGNVGYALDKAGWEQRRRAAPGMRGDARG
jgi:hypothetical protein